MVVDAARIEPVSTSNSLLTGKRTGNFAERRPPEAIFAPNRPTNSVAYNKIPYATEQGIFRCEQEIFYEEQGIFTPNGATLDFAFLSSTKQPRIMHHVLRGNFSNRAASARSAQGLDLSRMHRST
jgi:hypothetical protein